MCVHYVLKIFARTASINLCYLATFIHSAIYRLTSCLTLREYSNTTPPTIQECSEHVCKWRYWKIGITATAQITCLPISLRAVVNFRVGNRSGRVSFEAWSDPNTGSLGCQMAHAQVRHDLHHVHLKVCPISVAFRMVPSEADPGFVSGV